MNVLPTLEITVEFCSTSPLFLSTTNSWSHSETREVSYLRYQDNRFFNYLITILAFSRDRTDLLFAKRCIAVNMIQQHVWLKTDFLRTKEKYQALAYVHDSAKKKNVLIRKLLYIVYSPSA
mmetsp:Transcript_22320/g.33359  ORF Transcript_22320/g.33359 Transcript_22320/m.33359 type:complete len:121 (-) Transcript_22320:77-439(-)